MLKTDTPQGLVPSAQSPMLAYFYQAMPVALTLVLYRFLHVIDLRMVGEFGDSIRLLHSVQYNLTVLGSFVGAASMTTILVLWPHYSKRGSELNLIHKVIAMTALVGVPIFLTTFTFRELVLNYFQLDGDSSLNSIYLMLGCLNAVLLAIQLGIDGVLLSQKRQTLTVLNTALLLVGNVLSNYLSIYLFKNGYLGLRDCVLMFSGASALWLISGIAFTYWISRKGIAKPKNSPNDLISQSPDKTIFLSVWTNELTIGLVRAVAPICFAFQIGWLLHLDSFLVVFQSVLHIAFIAAMPLQAGLPIAVREKSIAFSSGEASLGWLVDILKYGFLPALILFLVFGAWNTGAVNFIFSMNIDDSYTSFIFLFFFGCIIGQVGHVLSVPLRAALKSRKVTYAVTASELLTNNLGLMLISLIWEVTPKMIGMLTVVYCTTYTAIIFSMGRQRS